MNWLKKKFERVALTLVALAALAAAVLMVLRANSFAELFQVKSAPQKGDLGITEDDNSRVRAAGRAIMDRKEWIAPTTKIKKVPIPLNVSVTLVEKGGRMYNLSAPESPENPPLRPPMSNAFLVKYDLQYTYKNVNEFDPDGDGFSNEEEFRGNTNPTLDSEYPPLTDKLVVLERETHEYTLKFGAVIQPQFQVMRVRPKRRAWFVEKGDTFEEGRFKIQSFAEKKISDPTMGEKNVSELLVLDQKSNETLTLVYREDFELPDYTAHLLYTRKGEEKISVRRGGEFQLPDDPEKISYKLIDITEAKAIITPSDNPKKQIFIPYLGK